MTVRHQEKQTTSKRALVLSGGGMFGSYQAGVWDVLSRCYQPDLIVGASVGSLNGFLIASGTPPGQLVERWLSLGEIEQLPWRISHRLAEGWIDSSILESWIQEFFERPPQCEFAVVATETRTLQQKVFAWPELNWQHVAASCGVPILLPTYKIEGVHYSDGGLLDPLPIWAAIELGATEIVSVNVMNRRPAAMQRISRILQKWAGCDQRMPNTSVPSVAINPSEVLGRPRDSMYWSRSNAERWIELGRSDARAVCAEWLSNKHAGGCTASPLQFASTEAM